ncbi:hypothetical protein H6F42_20225 [Pseudanabaena sp. FACHB-1998]|uniref:hypothetical protein n=1 Tax=Pseudanabaena sp. FACHB-1998 TaxID=2692858 RepID=UPI001680926E|nr:hypothetical protein [Pseudanabaena sp. FACHB-1998]MBD2179254.1 hypothetical protein [Pseudanabaena sp. FACHB-1998]
MLYKRIIQITSLAISSAAIAIFHGDFATAQFLPKFVQNTENVDIFHPNHFFSDSLS